MTNIEVMTAYFVDLTYNHMYLEGKKLKINGKVGSITEGYKHALNAFLKSLSNDNLYKKAVMGIHQYFITFTSFSTISFGECVDRLSASFAPADYFKSLRRGERMGILRLVIKQAMQRFITKIVTEYMAMIIDKHEDTDNVRIMQDELVNCFLLEREGVFQRFIASSCGKKTDQSNIEAIIAKKMQKEIKNLILEKITLKKENNALKRIIMKKNGELQEYMEKCGVLETTVLELESDLNKAKASRPRRRTSHHVEYDDTASFMEAGEFFDNVDEKRELSAYMEEMNVGDQQVDPQTVQAQQAKPVVVSPHSAPAEETASKLNPDEIRRRRQERQRKKEEQRRAEEAAKLQRKINEERQERLSEANVQTHEKETEKENPPQKPKKNRALDAVSWLDADFDLNNFGN